VPDQRDERQSAAYVCFEGSAEYASDRYSNTDLNSNANRCSAYTCGFYADIDSNIRDSHAGSDADSNTNVYSHANSNANRHEHRDADTHQHTRPDIWVSSRSRL
jgi:hypothetical protein